MYLETGATVPWSIAVLQYCQPSILDELAGERVLEYLHAYHLVRPRRREGQHRYDGQMWGTRLLCYLCYSHITTPHLQYE